MPWIFAMAEIGIWPAARNPRVCHQQITVSFRDDFRESRVDSVQNSYQQESNHDAQSRKDRARRPSPQPCPNQAKETSCKFLHAWRLKGTE